MPANDSATGGREPGRYEIRVRGPIGPTMMQAFPTLAASRSGQDTLLTGPLPDESALYGVIAELETLGLQLRDPSSVNRRFRTSGGLTDAMRPTPPEAAPPSMTVENKHPEFGAYRHSQPEIVRTMRCRLVRATTRLGGHMKISLLNPHVS